MQTTTTTAGEKPTILMINKFTNKWGRDKCHKIRSSCCRDLQIHP